MVFEDTPRLLIFLVIVWVEKVVDEGGRGSNASATAILL